MRVIIPARYKLKGGNEMAYKIEENCISCGACADGCPVDCITEGAPYSIDENACIDCGNCASVCPVGAPVEA